VRETKEHDVARADCINIHLVEDPPGVGCSQRWDAAPNDLPRPPVSGGDVDSELRVSVAQPKEFGAGEPRSADDRDRLHCITIHMTE
jgi:hypothetical protein